MVTPVEATIPTEQFALGDTTEAIPDCQFKTVPIVAHHSTDIFPFLRAWSTDLESLKTELHHDSSTKSVERISRGELHDLYRIEWNSRTRRIVTGLIDDFGIFLDSSCQGGKWRFKLLFSDHAAVSAAYNFCKERGVDLSIHQINGVNDLTDMFTRGGITLSDKQHEALTSAFETGYYGVPRGMTLQELSDQIGVSHQALSERLRRGHQALISDTLCDPPTEARTDS